MGDPELNRDPTRILSAGMLVTLLLLLVGTGFSFYELHRAMSDERSAVSASERVAFLIDTVAEDLSRERANVLESLTEDEPSTYQQLGQSIVGYERELHSAAGELAPLLRPTERPSWQELSQRVQAFRDDLSLAFTLAGRGQRDAAEQLLDRVAERATLLFGDLAALTRLHETHAQEQVRSAEQELRFTLLAALALSIITSVVVLIIWLIAVRLLRRQREALARYTDRIENANRELDAFAGRVAHDLKNILSPIPLATEVIRMHPSETELVERSAMRVKRSMRNALDVLDGLLSFARAVEAPASAECAAVAEEALAVVDELQPLIAHVQADIRLDIDADAEVMCGHSLLHVVLLNLVGNAVKFLENRPVRQVVVRARLDGTMTLIEVEDTGPGIAPAEVSRIFEPFYRAPGTIAAGHGIGLATVQRIVSAWGGSISVASMVGKGSVFTISLPRGTTLGGPASAFGRRSAQLAHS